MSNTDKLNQIETELLQLRKEASDSLIEIELLKHETFAKLEDIQAKKKIREKRLKELEDELNNLVIKP